MPFGKETKQGENVFFSPLFPRATPSFFASTSIVVRATLNESERIGVIDLPFY